MSLARNTSVYLLLGFLPIASNFFLAPVYTAYLKPEQYALVGIATLFQTFATFFVSLSLDGAYNRLFFKYHGDVDKSKQLISSLLIVVCSTTLIVWGLLSFVGNDLFMFLLKNREFRFSNFGWWVLITTFSNVLFSFYCAYFSQ